MDGRRVEADGETIYLVKDMKATREQRFIKATPKELRGSVRAELTQ